MVRVRVCDEFRSKSPSRKRDRCRRWVTRFAPRSRTDRGDAITIPQLVSWLVGARRLRVRRVCCVAPCVARRAPEIEIGETVNSSTTDASKQQLACGLAIEPSSVGLDLVAVTVDCVRAQKKVIYEGGSALSSFVVAAKAATDAPRRLLLRKSR